MTPQVTQDALGTHLDWEHEGVTPGMIDCACTECPASNHAPM